MKNIFTFLFLFTLTTLTAQLHPTCDGQRYQSDVFEGFEVTTDILYGSGTTIGGEFTNLFLDIYEPEGDIAESRPVILLAFGGSFIGGERDDLDWLCEAFAKKGFVAVTIDYRLYDLPLFPIPTEEEMQEVVVKSISDMKAAIRFLKEDAATVNNFRVDPDYIFIGGVSAGAITAAHTAVLDSTDNIPTDLLDFIEDNGGFEGNSSANFEYSSEVKGLVNFSGGLSDASWIDAEDPTFISFHDDDDGTVPYGAGYASIFFIDIIYMEGSAVLKIVADSIGVPNELHTIENSNGHVSYFNNDATTQEVLDTTALFLYDIICEGFTSVDAEFDAELLNISIAPNPTDGLLFIKNESGLALNLTLFNTLGQQLSYWENQSEINLSSFENGVYYLQIEDQTSLKKVIKRIVVASEMN